MSMVASGDPAVRAGVGAHSAIEIWLQLLGYTAPSKVVLRVVNVKSTNVKFS